MGPRHPGPAESRRSFGSEGVHFSLYPTKIGAGDDLCSRLYEGLLPANLVPMVLSLGVNTREIFVIVFGVTGLNRARELRLVARDEREGASADPLRYPRLSNSGRWKHWPVPSCS